jgi:hypothetical protein
MSSRENTLSSSFGIHPNTKTPSRRMNLIVSYALSFADRKKLRKLGKSDTDAFHSVSAKSSADFVRKQPRLPTRVFIA